MMIPATKPAAETTAEEMLDYLLDYCERNEVSIHAHNIGNSIKYWKKEQAEND